jgi:predicted metal-dependent hydrolase
MMRARRLKMDFSKVPPHWASNAEFAQHANVSSLIPVHVEPFLIRVMLEARSKLGPEHEELIKDIDILVKQEVQHHHMHRDFNRVMAQAGYDGLATFEQELSRDYKSWLKEKSLRFKCAYCEGFETLGLIGAYAYFEGYGSFLEGADQHAVDLWRWHMAEEFEHRTVCHRVYRALFGKTFFGRYFYRLYGLLYAIRHLGGWKGRVAGYLMATDREKMSGAERVASQLRERAVKRTQGRVFLRRLIYAFLPYYNPAGYHIPEGMEEFLSRVEREYGDKATPESAGME